MQSILFIFNTAPYQNELVYNGLRLATQLLKQEGVEVSVFLQSEAVHAAASGQQPPHLKYNAGEILSSLIDGGAAVKCCGVCLDARGVTAEQLVPGAARGTMLELADWSLAADKVLVF